MSEELKPCPFCNQAARAVPDSEHSTAHTLQHHSKGCPIDDLWDWYPDEEQAIAAWNQRAKPVVRALVWKDPGTGFEKAEPFGLLEYEVGSAEEDGGEGFFWYEYLSDKYVTGFVDEAAAKAAAQADFTSRVHACLEGYDD